MALADDVIGIAKDAQQAPGQTVGNALDAYHLASTTENARQQLDVQKQEANLKRANFFLDSLHNISKMPEGSQGIALEGLSKSMPQLMPGSNPDIMRAFQKDKDLRQTAFRAVAPYISQGGIQTPDQADNIFNVMSGDVPTAVATIQKLGEEQTKKAVAAITSQGGRTSAMQDNAVVGAVKQIHSAVDPYVKKVNAFDTDLQQLSSKPNWQTFNEAFINYAGAISGLKGQVSDAKLKEMQAVLSGPKVGAWSTFTTNNPGAKENAADPEAVKWLQEKIHEVSKVTESQMASTARRRAMLDSKLLHNKNIASALTQTAEQYQDGSWRQTNPNYNGPGRDFGSSQPADQSAGGAPAAADPLAAFNAWKAAGKPKAGGQ